MTDRRTPSAMAKLARVDVDIYAHMAPAELCRAAQEHIKCYSARPPHPSLAGTYTLLLDAWEWAERKHRRTK